MCKLTHILCVLEIPTLFIIPKWYLNSCCALLFRGWIMARKVCYSIDTSPTRTKHLLSTVDWFSGYRTCRYSIGGQLCVVSLLALEQETRLYAAKVEFTVCDLPARISLPTSAPRPLVLEVPMGRSSRNWAGRCFLMFCFICLIKETSLFPCGNIGSMLLWGHWINHTWILAPVPLDAREGFESGQDRHPSGCEVRMGEPLLATIESQTSANPHQLDFQALSLYIFFSFSSCQFWTRSWEFS